MPPLPFGRPTPHRNCLPETVPWPVPKTLPQEVLGKMGAPIVSVLAFLLDSEQWLHGLKHCRCLPRSWTRDSTS
ncbi:hypothetical protein V6N11_045018 [Hibiscus sabdariffa]|uniref:Uncharacterized protein n=1 Tax=Hibiscus sabdariffa TaxID=183260 RepID=A0ABR1Z9U2_9ROSI